MTLFKSNFKTALPGHWLQRKNVTDNSIIMNHSKVVMLLNTMLSKTGDYLMTPSGDIDELLGLVITCLRACTISLGCRERRRASDNDHIVPKIFVDVLFMVHMI